jgi:hypothetical protein
MELATEGQIIDPLNPMDAKRAMVVNLVHGEYLSALVDYSYSGPFSRLNFDRNFVFPVATNVSANLEHVPAVLEYFPAIHSSDFMHRENFPQLFIFPAKIISTCFPSKTSKCNWLKSYLMQGCKPCYYALIEAVEPFKLHPMSTAYIYKVFEHLLRLWMGHGFTFTSLPPHTLP